MLVNVNNIFVTRDFFRVTAFFVSGSRCLKSWLVIYILKLNWNELSLIENMWLLSYCRLKVKKNNTLHNEQLT